MHRYEIPEDQFRRIEHLLPGKPGDPGITADNRLFLDAVAWVAGSCAPWPDLPERFGEPKSVSRRFDRWSRKGVRWRAFHELKTAIASRFSGNHDPGRSGMASPSELRRRTSWCDRSIEVAILTGRLLQTT